VLPWLIVCLLYQGEAACAQARPRFWCMPVTSQHARPRSRPASWQAR